MSRATATPPHRIMRLRGNHRECIAFDFTVMRGHDLFIGTNHKTLMALSEQQDDFGIARVLETLTMMLKET